MPLLCSYLDPISPWYNVGPRLRVYKHKQIKSKWREKLKSSLKDKIDKLRDEGYQVEIQHFREYFAIGDSQASEGNNINPRGGRTVVNILKDEVQIVATGEAICCDKDNYSKRLGGLIALGRAEAKLRNNALVK